MARHQFAVFALAAIAITSTFWILLDIVAVYSRSATAFELGAFETRYDVLRKALPPRSVLGYVSDNPANNLADQGEFYATQYTLAPALVKASSEEHMVVGNFHTNKPDQMKLRARNLVVVQDFGNDIYLCTNTTKP